MAATHLPGMDPPGGLLGDLLDLPGGATAGGDTTMTTGEGGMYGGVVSDSDGGVMVQDLLGGFTEVVATDTKPQEKVETSTSATSFFLLDLDSGGGGSDNVVGQSAPPTNFLLGGGQEARPVSAMDSMSDNSEVLSISEANLPMDKADGEELLSGFFFNDVLQADSGLSTLATAATVEASIHSNQTSSETLVASDLIMDRVGGSEENMDSIMDLDIPPDNTKIEDSSFQTTVEELGQGMVDTEEDRTSENLVMTSNPLDPVVKDEETHDAVDAGEGRLVKMDTSENLVMTTDLMDPVVKEEDKTAEKQDAELEEHPLAAELLPVFEMCDPEGKGWISVGQLEELCRAQGQVILHFLFQFL